MLLVAIALAEVQSDDEIKVKVQIAEGSVIVDLSPVVPATLQKSWAVLTDFEHMAEFFSM